VHTAGTGHNPLHFALQFERLAVSEVSLGTPARVEILAGPSCACGMGDERWEEEVRMREMGEGEVEGEEG
jgi:hypothetical protein